MIRRASLVVVVLFTIGFTFYVVGESDAFSTGIFGFSGMTGATCTTCHSGGVAPTVILEGPASVAPGQTADYTFRVISNDPANQTAAGLNVAATDGTFASRGSYTQVLGGEITHTGPKPNNASGFTTFGFSWTAPNTAGVVTMYGAGNSVNQNGNPTGDLPNTDIFTIQVAAPTDVTLTELTGAPGRSPWLLAGIVLVASLFAILLRQIFRTNPKKSS